MLLRRHSRQIISRLLAEGSIVADLSCGNMALEALISEKCKGYIPFDVVNRKPDIQICDFNKNGEIPENNANTFVATGLLEYIDDVVGFLREMKRHNKTIYLTYDLTPGVYRDLWGYKNRLDKDTLEMTFHRAGLKIIEQGMNGPLLLYILN